MSLRARMLIAFGVVVLIPLALLSFWLRQEITRRFSEEYQARVDAVVEIIEEDLKQESEGISQRLVSLKSALVKDNSFRLAAVAGVESEQANLIDYASSAMDFTGLSMLQIHDADGVIISSGHFRNEHGRVEPHLVTSLTKLRDGAALVTTRVPEREFLALARAEPFRIGNRDFTLVGGVAVDANFLSRLARDPAIVVSLEHPGGILASRSTAAHDNDANDAFASAPLEIPLIHMPRTGGETPLETISAYLKVTQPLTPLRVLQRNVDILFIMTGIAAGAAALLLALWLSSRISKPLADLAAKTAVLDLDRLDIRFEGGSDEVGRLSRLLGDLASRLRTSTARVREAERRATVGDLARQINHDIKNGLIPLRNVMRHLEQVERNEPAALPTVFAERRQTVDSSIAYLETLASSYQKLSPSPERRNCDLNALIRDLVGAAQGRERVEFTTQLQSNLPYVVADPIALRRILENLTTNAVESLGSKAGRVHISTERLVSEPESVRIVVADTGSGMSKEEAGLIFNDFYTTKDTGTGLGLSIVRRLVMDLNGTIAVESEAGKGARFIVEIPSGDSERT
jgi:signal transduction histidine kinase